MLKACHQVTMRFVLSVLHVRAKCEGDVFQQGVTSAARLALLDVFFFVSPLCLIVRQRAAEEGLARQGGVEAKTYQRERDDQYQYVIACVPRREFRGDRKEDHQVQEEKRRDQRQQPVAIQHPDHHQRR
jgi:hypothetical protein